MPTKILSRGLLLSFFGGAVACSPSNASPDGVSKAGASAMAAPDDAGNSVKCQYFPEIPVAIGTPPGPAPYTVSGELYATEDELVDGATVQLLIHGATYNHEYWNFGIVNEKRYSYSRSMAVRGFPTFALDELGAGNSSRPPSDQMTIDTAALVAHAMVQALRSGSINGIQFGKVIIVGHSLGSVVAWQEAISYGDVDGVIATGAAHFLTSAFLDLNLFYPAMMDPKFSDSALDDGYLTTVPGIRAAFYSSPDFDPAVVALDEKRKDLVPGPELMTGLPVVLSTATQAIQVPVLTILGGNDLTACGTDAQGRSFDCSYGAIVASQEAPFYSPNAQIQACIVPDSGQDISLALNNDLQVRDSAAWSFRFVGQRQLAQKHDFDDGSGFDDIMDRLPDCGGPTVELQ